LALGVISFALVVVVGLFGSLMTRHADVKDRQDVVAAVNALNNFLDQEEAFVDVFNKVRQGPWELLFVQFRTNADGTPNPSGARLESKWYTASASIDPAVDAAREGRWIRAVVSLDPTLNPVSSLPASIAGYSDPRLVLSAKIYVVSTPDVPLQASVQPLITVPIAVTR
jgi:hypothetical protein